MKLGYEIWSLIKREANMAWYWWVIIVLVGAWLLESLLSGYSSETKITGSGGGGGAGQQDCHACGYEMNCDARNNNRPCPLSGIQCEAATVTGQCGCYYDGGGCSLGYGPCTVIGVNKTQ